MIKYEEIDVDENEIVAVGKGCDYFKNFIRDCISELKHKKRTFVFSKKQVEEIKKKFPNITVKEDERIYYLKLKNQKKN